MSVAYDFSTVDLLPASAPVRRPVSVPEADPGRRLASVSVLHAPVTAPALLRLTRRGQVVVTLLVALVGGAFLWLAAASAPASAPRVAGPATVTVVPGDTLWSIASRAAPQSDPAAEVAALQRRNHLSGVALIPGQVLRVR